ncbi:hypothetical protein [Rhizobium azibense]|nr:hypothetical protein [Rhizobium azibense]
MHIPQLLGERATVGFLTRIGTGSFSKAFAAELVADSLDVCFVLRDTLVR